MSLFFKALPELWSQTFPVHEFFPNLPSPAPFPITTVCWPTPHCSLPHPSNCRPIMILYHALCTFTSYSLLLSATPRTWGLLLLQMILPCPNVFSWFLYFFIISPGMWLGSTMPLHFLLHYVVVFTSGFLSALDTLCSFSTLTCVILSVFLVSGETSAATSANWLFYSVSPNPCWNMHFSHSLSQKAVIRIKCKKWNRIWIETLL